MWLALTAGMAMVALAPASAAPCVPDQPGLAFRNLPAPGSTTDRAIVHTRIAGRDYGIPKNYFRHPQIGCGVEQDGMLLRVLLPDLLPYSREIAAEFDTAPGWSRRMSILAKRQAKRVALEQVIAISTRGDPGERNFDPSLGLHFVPALRHGRVDRVYLTTEDTKITVVIGCDATIPDSSFIPPTSPACAHHFEHGGLRVKAMYSRTFASQWREIETSIKALLERFGRAPEAASPGAENGLAAFGRWSRIALAIEADLMTVYKEAGTMDVLAARALDHAVSAATVRRQAAHKMARLQQSLADVSARLSQLRALATSSEYDQSTAPFLRHLAEFRDQIALALKDSDDAVEAALRGDRAVRSRLRIKRLDRYAALLRSEIAVNALRMIEIGHDHPQRALLDAISFSNEALINLVAVIQDRMRDRTPDPGHRVAFDRAIEQARSAMKTGRRQAEAWGMRLDRDGTIPADQARLLREGMQTYDASFTVEARIAGVLELFARALFDPSGARGDPAKLLERVGPALDDLANERGRLQGERAAVLTRWPSAGP